MFQQLIAIGAYIPVGLAVLLTLMVLLIAFAVHNSVTKLADPNLKLVPAPEDKYAREYTLTATHDQWAESQGFDYLGAYLLHGPATFFIAAWQLRNMPTFLCVYCHGENTHFDIVTIYSEHQGLTTGSSKDGQTLPRAPGSYAQTFSNLDLDAMWTRHQQAEKYLHENARMQANPGNLEFEPLFIDAVRREAQFVQSIPLYPFRGVYWFFVRRHQRHNRTIEQQHARGMINFQT